MEYSALRKDLSQHAIIKGLKSFLSSKNDIKIIKSVRYIEQQLNSCVADVENYTELCNTFLESDISHFLRESLATMNIQIITLIFKCWLYLTDAEMFFTQNYAVSALEATTRCTRFILCKTYDEQDIDLALRAIHKMAKGILKYDCHLQDDIIQIHQLIDLLSNLFETHKEANPISIKCYEIFETLLPMPIWKSNTFTKLYILFDDSLKILLNSYDDSDLASNRIEVIDRMNDLCRKTIHTCSTTPPTVLDNIFENSEDNEYTVTIERVVRISYDTFVNICAPAYMSARCNLSPLPHCNSFLNFILEFFSSNCTGTYTSELAVFLAKMGILQRLKSIIYLGAHLPGLTNDCLTCASYILTCLADTELDARSYRNGLKTFQSNLVEGLSELPDDPTHWYGVFEDSSTSELATVSLLVYVYFEIRATDDRESAVQQSLPRLVRYICSLPEPRYMHRLVMKALWFVFACSFLSASPQELVCGTTSANNWLLAAVTDSNLEFLYTHDITLILWSFRLPLLPSKLVKELLLLYMSKSNGDNEQLKPLIEQLPGARLVLIDMICSERTDVIDTVCNLLLESTRDADKLEQAPKSAWDALAKFLTDPKSPADNTIGLIRLCVHWPNVDVHANTILRCFKTIIEIFEGAFEPSSASDILAIRCFRVSSMRLMSHVLNEFNNRSDERALKTLLNSARCLTVIDINTLCRDQEVVMASWALLNTISNLQKTPGPVELPLHPDRLLQIWSDKDKKECTAVSLRLATSVFANDCPAPTISLKLGEDTGTAVEYIHSIAFTLQWMCSTGFEDAWPCFSALHKYSAHSNILMEPVAKFHFTQSLIRTELHKGIRSLDLSFLHFLESWFSLLETLDKRTNFIKERANNPFRKFTNCYFSHLFDGTLGILSRILLHDQTSHLDKEARKLVAIIERYISQHRDVLSEDLFAQLQKHSKIIDL